MDLNQIVMNIFLIIGMIVCIVVTTIALVYGICFVVRLLVKTFAVRVSSSCEIISEDIIEKKKAKQQRKQERRQAKLEQKEELQKLKLESIARVGEMKRQKYQEKLIKKENKKYEKIFGEPNPNPYQPPKPEPKKLEVENKETLVEELGQDVTYTGAEFDEQTQVAVEEMTSYGTDGEIVLRGDKMVNTDEQTNEEDFSVEPSINEEGEGGFALSVESEEQSSETISEVDEFKKEFFENPMQEETEEQNEDTPIVEMMPPPSMEQQTQPKKRGRKKKIVS